MGGAPVRGNVIPDVFYGPGLEMKWNIRRSSTAPSSGWAVGGVCVGCGCGVCTRTSIVRHVLKWAQSIYRGQGIVFIAALTARTDVVGCVQSL